MKTLKHDTSRRGKKSTWQQNNLVMLSFLWSCLFFCSFLVKSRVFFARCIVYPFHTPGKTCYVCHNFFLWSMTCCMLFLFIIQWDKPTCLDSSVGLSFEISNLDPEVNGRPVTKHLICVSWFPHPRALSHTQTQNRLKLHLKKNWLHCISWEIDL